MVIPMTKHAHALIGLVAACFIGLTPALAQQPVYDGTGGPPTTGMGMLHNCMETAQDVKGGMLYFVKVEHLMSMNAQGTVLALELRDRNGREWEFMCDAAAGSIVEVEQEVDSASDQMFSRRAQVSEDDARQTVLDMYGGEIVEVEYEIESDGSPTYEFDTVADGTEWKVEVSAETGRIIETHVEHCEIGVEEEERTSVAAK